jgi:hypothetical protein
MSRKKMINEIPEMDIDRANRIFKEFKRTHNITDQVIATAFGFPNNFAFRNSDRRDTIVKGIAQVVELCNGANEIPPFMKKEWPHLSASERKIAIQTYEGSKAFFAANRSSDK